MMNKRVLSIILLCVTLLPNIVCANMAAADKADNGFMMICTVLVLFMTLPGIALFYGGLLRAKNILSLMTQVMVTFALVSVLWVIYGYALIFGQGGAVWGNLQHLLLHDLKPTDINGTIYQFIHVAFQGSFACITVALVTGAFAERIRFSAVLIFSTLWFTFSYIPMAHMVWGEGYLAQDGAIDFAGGTVVHINAAVAGLVGAYCVGKRSGFGKEAFKPHSLPMAYMGTAILYIGWFGFNAGSAGAADETAALAFINTVVATAGAVLSWTITEWLLRGKPSLLGACSGCIAGLVAITPAAGTVGVGGALLLGFLGGVFGLWGVVALKHWLGVDDVCDVFGIHGVCGIVGCLATAIFTSSSLGGTGLANGVTIWHQLTVQLWSVVVCLFWSACTAWLSFKIAGYCVGLRIDEEQEREGMDIHSHGERAYNN